MNDSGGKNEEEGGERDFRRRKTIQKIGLSLGLGSAMALSLSANQKIDLAHEETSEGKTVNPKSSPLSEDETPFAVWQYEKKESGYESTSPINVVFPLENRSFSDVLDVFKAKDWYPYPEEFVRYAWDRESQEFQKPDWTGAEAYFGITGRLHVRCWEFEGVGSVQAHFDSPTFHDIESYAKARQKIVEIFEKQGWVAEYRGINLRNDKKPDHDGTAAVIREGGR